MKRGLCHGVRRVQCCVQFSGHMYAQISMRFLDCVQNIQIQFHACPIFGLLPQCSPTGETIIHANSNVMTDIF